MGAVVRRSEPVNRITRLSGGARPADRCPQRVDCRSVEDKHTKCRVCVDKMQRVGGQSAELGRMSAGVGQIRSEVGRTNGERCVGVNRSDRVFGAESLTRRTTITEAPRGGTHPEIRRPVATPHGGAKRQRSASALILTGGQEVLNWEAYGATMTARCGSRLRAGNRWRCSSVG